MPHVHSPYNAPGAFKNAHFSTIYSAKLRPVPKILQTRERLLLTDGDFLDIDWSFSEKNSGRIALLLHGLEGNAQRRYMKGQARAFVTHGLDVAAVNLRGCSGEVNTSYGSYNAGRTDDVSEVVEAILKKGRYHEIGLIGFSLGGNLLLKYLGEQKGLPKEIKKGVAISTPLSLQGSLKALTQFYNWVYRTSFLYSLKKKYKLKMEHFPERMTPSELKKIKSLLDFDNHYTAPAHGFKNAQDYYEKNSSLQFLPHIRVPVLLLNAKNDTFLSPACFPYELAATSEYIYLETPEHGGHVGFHNTNSLYYSEQRACAFVTEKL